MDGNESGRGQPHSKTSRKEMRATRRDSPESFRESAAVLCRFDFRLLAGGRGERKNLSKRDRRSHYSDVISFSQSVSLNSTF
jgi:hypothetical protein